MMINNGVLFTVIILHVILILILLLVIIPWSLKIRKKSTSCSELRKPHKQTGQHDILLIDKELAFFQDWLKTYYPGDDATANQVYDSRVAFKTGLSLRLQQLEQLNAGLRHLAAKHPEDMTMVNNLLKEVS